MLSNFFMKRCYLLYISVAITVILLLFCIYLYKKYTKENKEEDKIILTVNSNKQPDMVATDCSPENIEEIPLENEKNIENVKENLINDSIDNDSVHREEYSEEIIEENKQDNKEI